VAPRRQALLIGLSILAALILLARFTETPPWKPHYDAPHPIICVRHTVIVACQHSNLGIQRPTR
jgi:hypothetical protein